MARSRLERLYIPTLMLLMNWNTAVNRIRRVE